MVNMLAVLTMIVTLYGSSRGLVMGEAISEMILELDLPSIGSPGLAVTVAWVTLAVSGRWQPQLSWIDRVGRLMGCGWIGLMILHLWILSTFKGAWL